MNGLLKKEWYIMAKQMRFWIVLMLVYSALSVTGVWGSGMMSAMVCVILFTAPMSLFTQDRMSHWDAFAAALPNGRRAAVKARYLFSLALALFCIVLVMACSALLYLLGLAENANWAELLVTGGFSVFLSLFFISILMPLLYRFGPDKARIMIIIVYLFVFLGVIGFFMILPEGTVENLETKFYLLLPVVLLVVLAAALCLSYRISLAIHQKQEF